MKRQLHITNWYPNPFQEFEAPFIQEHFAAIPNEVERELWHVQVRSEGGRFRLLQGSIGDREHYLLLDTPIKTWRIREWLHLWLLTLLRMRLGTRWWDVVNLHIAYPLMRFPGIFRKLFGKEVVITEHWSAYHKGFNLSRGSRAWNRISQIFRHKIPVITVSKALMRDVKDFAQRTDFPQHVIPNVVNPAIFYPCISDLRGKRDFVMVGAWAPIKRPILVMRAFSNLIGIYPDARLRIIGYGEQMAAMQVFVSDRNLDDSIQFLGALPKEKIAIYLRESAALLHASEYETFSVVCAEALSCGTPVIASKVGGIPEFVDENNGLLVENSEDAWLAMLKAFLRRKEPWDHERIAHDAVARFSPTAVGTKLEGVVESVVAGSQVI